MHNPLVAIGLAGLAAWLFGSAWYMSLGKVWQAALGLNPDDCKDKKMPATPLVVCLLAEWVMAAVLYQTLDHLGVMGWMAGAIAGLTLGVGLMLTSTLVTNLFQGKTLMVTVIDGGHWVIVAAIEGAVIGALL
ncbi:MAG: hypothetical protein JWP16_1615 [Alphaproteobacteria bacterium]|nr:hypothetical protein [Alphaproteobacteria bacterium]MDB5740575.1 hypothetical protein [Alphaproteobacteria bacterium]